MHANPQLSEFAPVAPAVKRDQLVAASLLANFGEEDDDDEFTALTNLQAAHAAERNKFAAVQELQVQLGAERRTGARRAIRVEVA